MLRRNLPLLGATLALGLGFAGEAAAGQDVARVREATPAYAAASPASREVDEVVERTRWTSSPTVLPVVERAEHDGAEWLRVRLPARPNGSTAWIPASMATLQTVDEHLVVDVSRRRMALLRGDQTVRTFKVVVGTRRTPTPVGEFFITERLRLRDRWAKRAWALATSAYSEVLTSFGGGDGQVALHGRGRLRARLGTAASNGCVRLADRDAAWLARRVPDGTPLTVER